MLDYDPKWSEVDPWVRMLHDVWVHDGRAYLAQWDAGTWIVDVSNPRNPRTFRTSAADHGRIREIPSSEEQDEVIGLPGNAHFVMTNEDASLLAGDKEAWDTDGPKHGSRRYRPLGHLGPRHARKLTTIGRRKRPTRVTTSGALLAPVRPLRRRRRIGPRLPRVREVSSSGQWTASHNFDFVGDRLYTLWYDGVVKLFDVSEPAEPKESFWWPGDPNEAAFCTARCVFDEVFIGGSMGHHGD